MFLTRIPCPNETSHGADALAKSVGWWPIVGWLLGSTGGAAVVAARLVMPPEAAAVVGVAIMALLTGCLHEDAFADLCDGFGGFTPERRLEIMRDSRVGSYGVMGLVLITALRIELIASMHPLSLIFSLGAAMAVARWTAVLLLKIGKGPTDPASLAAPFSKWISWPGVLWSTGALLPLMVLGPVPSLALVGSAALIAMLGAWFFKGFTGGVTGDCAGATILFTEVVCLALLNHITVTIHIAALTSIRL